MLGEVIERSSYSPERSSKFSDARFNSLRQINSTISLLPLINKSQSSGRREIFVNVVIAEARTHLQLTGPGSVRIETLAMLVCEALQRPCDALARTNRADLCAIEHRSDVNIQARIQIRLRFSIGDSYVQRVVSHSRMERDVGVGIN